MLGLLLVPNGKALGRLMGDKYYDRVGVEICFKVLRFIIEQRVNNITSKFWGGIIPTLLIGYWVYFPMLLISTSHNTVLDLESGLIMSVCLGCGCSNWSDDLSGR